MWWDVNFWHRSKKNGLSLTIILGPSHKDFPIKSIHRLWRMLGNNYDQFKGYYDKIDNWKCIPCLYMVFWIKSGRGCLDVSSVGLFILEGAQFFYLLQDRINFSAYHFLCFCRAKIWLFNFYWLIKIKTSTTLL